jgi:hypothetical protein
MPQQFKTNKNIDRDLANGTCLQGEIDADYNYLVTLFGQPTNGDGYKVDAEWVIQFEDGTIATIYNWKDGPNDCGDDGIPVECIRDWHIGGFSKIAVERVEKVLKDG